MFVIYLLIGVAAGILSGLFGIGGGVVIIPALAKLFAHSNVIPPSSIMHMAIGTSLATVIFTSLSALYAHHRRKTVRWDMVRLLAPGLVVGSVCGAMVTNHLSSGFLRIFFGIFLLVLSLHLFFRGHQKITGSTPSSFTINLISVCIGGLGGVLGVGGGILLVPFLLRCQLDMHSAAGTSVIGAFVIGVVATISFVTAGLLSPNIQHVAWSTGYVYWPAFLGIIITSMLFAPVGAFLAHKLPRDTLKRLFAVFILLMACDMLF